MAQDALDDILLVDERNDAHLLAPVGPPLRACPSDRLSHFVRFP